MVADIKSMPFLPDAHKIVLTPDRYTLLIERALFGGGGALDTEALTLSRLWRRVCGGGTAVSKEGCIMLMSRAIAAVQSKLVYYKRAAQYADFANEAYAALNQLKSSNTSPDRLTASGITAAKLSDLQLVQAEYDRLKGNLIDAPDKLNALIAAADSELICKSHFFAVGFAEPTALNTRVFEALSKHAKSFTVYAAELPDELSRPIYEYSAPNAVTQYKAVAARIRDYAVNGGKYGDVAVVTTAPRALLRILREYDIPYYSEVKTPLYLTPPFAAINCLYRMKTQADTDALIELCKNPYTGISGSDAELLQSIVKSTGVTRGFRFDGLPQAAEAARVAALEALKLFDGNFTDAVNAVAEQFGFADRAREFLGESDCVTPLIGLAELVKNYGSGDFNRDAEMFFAAAHEVNVNSLPRRRDCVTVCSPASLRLSAVKRLYITDFNEGVLPEITTDSGLITDAEIESFGGAVSPSVKEQNKRNKRELLGVIANAEYVFATYSTSGMARRAAFIDECGTPVQSDYTTEAQRLKTETRPNAIAFFACTKAAARELAALNATSYGRELYAAAGRLKHEAAPFVPSVALPVLSKISVSELNDWFKCPYKRFLRFTVGVSERVTSELSAPDFGLALHSFMKRFTDGGMDTSAKNIEESLDAAIAENDLKVNAKTRSKFIDSASEFARLTKAQIFAGGYRPQVTELPFGGEIALGKNDVRLSGVIDRVDECGTSARIIDYKTGSKSFNLKNVYSGEDLQLPLYAAVVRKSKRVTGMFYVTAKGKYGGGDCRLSGCFIRDAACAAEYDYSLVSGAPSEIIKAQLNGDKFVRPTVNVMPEDEFDAMIDGAVKTAALGVDEMQDGYIARVPTETACAYCAYTGVCLNKKSIRAVKPEGGDDV